MFRTALNYALLVAGVASLVNPNPAVAQVEKPTEKKICYMVFLNRGKGGANFKGINKEAMEQMQEEHVGNLGKLGRSGKAFTAGPLGENGFIRGIVALNLPPGVKPMDCFTDDPYIQNGLLDVESYAWLCDASKFHKPADKFKIGEVTLGIVKKGPKWTPPKTTSPENLAPTLPAVAKAGDLAISGSLIGGKNRLGILLFRSNNRSKIQAAAALEPEIRSGRIVLELHSQWLDPTVLGVSK